MSDQSSFTTPSPCKFKVGETVSHPADLYGGELSEIIEIEKRLTNERGWVYIEGDIKSMQVPYTFDGNILTINMPEHDFGSWIQKAYTDIYVWDGYAITVRNDKITTRFPGNVLQKIK